MTKLGYVVPNSWGVEDPHVVTALSVEAEERGADSLWVSHHVLHAGWVADRLGDDGPYWDALTTLAVLAGATTTARLGTSVLVLPYLHPVPTAKALATIDHLSSGRLDLGVGVGGLRVEHDAVGQVPWERRGRYADEFLDVLRLLWSPGRQSYAGELFSFDDLPASPRPFSPSGVPVLVGGRGDAAVRRTVRHGQGWQSLNVEPDELVAPRAEVLDGLARAGRDADGFRFQVRLHIDVDDHDLDSWRRKIDAYAAAGIGEVLLAPQSGDVDAHRRWLDAVLLPLTKEL